MEAEMASQEAAAEVKRRHSSELMANPDIHGVGTARQGDDWVLEIRVVPGATGLDLPTELDGVPVHIVEDAPFRAGPAQG
jgi:hypothetical protein